MKRETYDDILQDRKTGLDSLDDTLYDLQFSISRLHNYGWSEDEIIEKVRRYYQLIVHYTDMINKVPNYPHAGIPDVEIFSTVEVAEAAAFRAEDAVDPAIRRTVKKELESCWYLEVSQSE